MDKNLNKLIMYHEIQRLHREGHSIKHIADFLVLNWRTIKKYLAMEEYEYQTYVSEHSGRKKELDDYEQFVKVKLEKYQSTSAAQMHDWLKEHYTDFPEVSPKTVYNFVMSVRQKYNLPKIAIERIYAPVEELPYGKQSQVDFGEYNARTTKGKRTKVYFFSMVLSRSRYKYVYFTDVPFTTQLSIMAHEKAFAFFRGIPTEIVYDQDKVFMVDENHGDLQLTKTFNRYIKQRGFNIYFCRKADPETKGKVENVVRYIKQNFLYNRTYSDIDTLNTEAVAWLHRTANYMQHGKTKLSPKDEWEKEQAYLHAFRPIEITFDHARQYTVRKDNCISYKSNLYSVPLGTWKGTDTKVSVMDKDGFIIILDAENNEICKHPKETGKGKTIINNNHKRNKTKRIQELIDNVAKQFPEPDKAKAYLEQIRQKMPRYTRDQLKVISECISNHAPETIKYTLDFCMENQLFNASDFASVALKKKSAEQIDNTPEIKPIKNMASIDCNFTPATSILADYHNILMN